MVAIDQLQERRQKLAAEISVYRQYLDPSGCWDSSERQEGWDKLTADYDETVKLLQSADEQKRLEVIERITAIEAAEAGPARRVSRVSGHEPRIPFDDGLRAWCKAQVGEVTDADRHAAHAHGFNLTARELTFKTPDYRRLRDFQNSFMRGIDPMAAPMDTTPAPDAGATIPLETFAERLEVNMLYFGPMLRVCDIITTASGEPLTLPIMSDTANAATIISENTSVGDGDPQPTFAQLQLGAFKYTSGSLLVPYELLQDTAVDLVGALTEALGERLGRVQNTHFTAGAGTTEPAGFVPAVATDNEVTAAASGAVAWEDLIDLEHGVDIAYRRPESIFMCHDTVLAEIRKLADAEGRPIWSAGINAGAPDRISGYNVIANNDMTATMAVTTTSVTFGDMRKYKIRRAGSVRFYRLTERYRDLDQDCFVALIRTDGAWLNPGTPPAAALVHPV